MANIVINPQNSPYLIPAGPVSYDQVTIEVGGYMYMEQQTNLTITTLIVNASARSAVGSSGASSPAVKASPKKKASKGRGRK